MRKRYAAGAAAAAATAGMIGLTALPAAAAPAALRAPAIVAATAPASARAVRVLQPGDRGAAVVTLQKRLRHLGYWVASVGGTYDQTTQQAVLAVQKAAGIGRDGVYGPQTARALAAAVVPKPHTRAGHYLEIDRTRQLALVVTNGKIRDVFNTSTGKAGWTTPTGRFRIFRTVDAMDHGPLGDLWRPRYFDGGIAIHGSPDIPGYPASHGCARVSNAAIDWIWSTNALPVGTVVWVYA